MNNLRLEAEEAQEKVEELKSKVKTLEQENLAKEQEITSLNHRNQLLEGEVEKLVLTQRASEKACLAAVTPGRTYSMWVWYKGSWAFSGASPTKVSLATYYRNSAGTWIYWQSSPLFAPSSAWALAYFTSAPLPADATAISFGLTMSGAGTLTTDDYALVMN